MSRSLLADVTDVRAVAEAAAAAAAVLHHSTSEQRWRWLTALADQLEARRAEFSAAIHDDTGKPRRWTDVEVDRAASIARLTAAEALNTHLDARRLDAQHSGAGRLAVTLRVPRGPVLGLSPFNFPLHLTVHKIAPAIAAGTSVAVIPSIRTPRTAALIADAVAAIGLPAGAVAVVLPDRDHRRTWQLIEDPAFPVISFTGSTEIGWRIVDAVPRKKVIAELGGNAAAVIAPDHCGPADLAHAAARIALFGYYHAGQACTSVQRVYVPATARAAFIDALTIEVAALELADDVGPLIDNAAAVRVRALIDGAVAAGARLIAGGSGTGRLVEPTILLDPPDSARVVVEEVFGPVVSVFGYADLDEALRRVNDSRFGLSAGIFTHDVRTGFQAAAALDVGQVVIGDVPTFRSDLTAFGGVKESGQGREGIRSAIEDYTVTRTVVLAEAGR